MKPVKEKILLPLPEILRGIRGGDEECAQRWAKVAEELPDSDVTVLGFNAQWDEPVWPCFHDGECWRCIEGMPLDEDHVQCASPTHWRHFPDPPTP